VKRRRSLAKIAETAKTSAKIRISRAEDQNPLGMTCSQSFAAFARSARDFFAEIKKATGSARTARVNLRA